MDQVIHQDYQNEKDNIQIPADRKIAYYCLCDENDLQKVDSPIIDSFLINDHSNHQIVHELNGLDYVYHDDIIPFEKFEKYFFKRFFLSTFLMKSLL